MNKDTLIKRFREKASSRKRQLFAMYGSLISSSENAEIIVDEIHEDLGEQDLITVTDIYYCKRYFAKKGASKNIHYSNESKKIQQKNTSWDDLKWTNPATIPRQTLRSKFAPPND